MKIKIAIKKLKLPTLILVIILSFHLLSACSQQNVQQQDNQNLPIMAYVPEFFTLLNDNGVYDKVSVYDDMLYFMSYGMVKLPVSYPDENTDSIIDEPTVEEDSGEEDASGAFIEQYTSLIYRALPDASLVEPLPDFKPTVFSGDEQGWANINGITIANDTIFVLEYISRYHISGEQYVDDGRNFVIRKLNMDGEELERFDITEIIANGNPNTYIQNMATDKNGNTILSTGENKLFVLSPDAQLLFTLESQNHIYRLFTLGDGCAAISTYEGNGEIIKVIDTDVGNWGETFEAPRYASEFYSGNSKYLYYADDRNNLVGYNKDTNTFDNLINWLDCDINSNEINTICTLDDGTVICVSNRNSDTGTVSELIVLTEQDISGKPQKTVLTLATVSGDVYNLRDLIINFNKRNPDFRIVIEDYSAYNTDTDYTLGLMKLNTEIIAGKIPDIISLDSLPASMYAAKGLFEDIYPFIDADPELSRDMFVESYIKALENDGKLYKISSQFSVNTLIASSTIVGDTPGWTFERMYECLATLPEGALPLPNTYRDTIIYYAMVTNMSSFVDWKKGECRFDSQEFIKVLEFAKTFPETPDYNNRYAYEDRISDTRQIQDGQALAMMSFVTDFQRIQLDKAIFAGDITFMGFPTENGTGNAFNSYSTFAISSKSAHKDVIWSFMRTLLTEEYQSGDGMWGFPSNQNAFNKLVEKRMLKEIITDENGEEVEISRSGWGTDDIMVDIYATTPEERDQIIDLINNTHIVTEYDEAIRKIIEDETGPFFAGQKSAAETAAIIQNRVMSYVNEQK